MQVIPIDTTSLADGDVAGVWRSAGWALWPLVVCALLAAAIVMRKLWELSVQAGRTLRLLEQVDALFARRMIAEALTTARESDTPGGRVIAAGLARRAAGSDRVARSIASVAAIEASALQRWLIPLAAIAAVAPLLGFLGSTLAAMRAIDAAAGAAGLASALVPAAVGLTVAIPVTLLHAWISSRIERLVARIAESGQRAVDAVQALEAETDGAP